MKNKTIGIIVIIVGILVATVSLLADILGVGGNLLVQVWVF